MTLFFIVSNDPRLDMLVRAETADEASRTFELRHDRPYNVVLASTDGAQRWINGEPFDLSMRALP